MDSPSSKNDTKTIQHVARYTVIGVILTLFNYVLYTILSNIVFNDVNLLWLSILISTTISTLLAFLLHSKITWKERPVAKSAKYKFFIWNLLAAFVLNPLLTQLFSLFTPLYEFAFHIFEILGVPFSYEFTLSTGAFILTTIITTIINFLFYDKFIFGKKEKHDKKQ